MTFVLYQSELKRFVDKKEERNMEQILKESMDNYHDAGIIYLFGASEYKIMWMPAPEVLANIAVEVHQLVP